ncbi:ankyrin repeat domain-containing protein 49-like isoform X2 [Leptopilina boulardi]|uniref:ankyrin repeat domain-containing protein 49-like isoform X2 n=1 Tax=Leptopilina boulardi TaxID=63433 RepID=UPI0021F65D5E|nr:ankyrin repeat domain-containing protein 49-like isoform X2 [Leptopilina boulardi]
MEEKPPYCSGFVVAAKKGNIKKLKNMFNNISKLSTKEEQCFYALYFAAFNGHVNIVKFLISKNINPNFVIGSYLTPLHAAVFSKNNEKIVPILLNAKANVNPKIKVTNSRFMVIN